MVEDGISHKVCNDQEGVQMSEIRAPAAPPGDKADKYKQQPKRGYGDYWSGFSAQTSALFVKARGAFSINCLLVYHYFVCCLLVAVISLVAVPEFAAGEAKSNIDVSSIALLLYLRRGGFPDRCRPHRER